MQTKKTEIKKIKEEIVSEKILYEMNSRERDSLVEIISNLNKYLESNTEMNDILHLNSFLKKQKDAVQICYKFLKKIK